MGLFGDEYYSDGGEHAVNNGRRHHIPRFQLGNDDLDDAEGERPFVADNIVARAECDDDESGGRRAGCSINEHLPG